MLLVFFSLFLLILGPVLDLGLGQLGDASFFFSIVIILYYFVFLRLKFPTYILVLISIVLLIFALVLLNTVFLDPYEIHIGIRAILRPVRVVVVLLSCYCISAIIFKKLRGQYIESHFVYFKVVSSIYYIILIHGVIMCLQFVFPDFRDYVYSYTFAKEQLEYNKLFRMAGLTGAGGAQTSYVQGLGCLIGWYLLFLDNYKRKYIVLLGNFVILVSIILSGRTGLLVCFLGFFIFSAMKMAFFIQRRRINISINPLLIVAVVLPFLLAPHFESWLGSNYRFFETAFNRTFKTFLNYKESGSVEDDTLNALLDMFIVPDNYFHLILGKSSYLENNTHYNIMTDIGYFRLIWGYGLCGLFLHVFFYFYLLLIVIRNSGFAFGLLYNSVLPISIILFTFIMNAKEIFFMTRISFHITLIVSFIFIMYSRCGRRGLND